MEDLEQILRRELRRSTLVYLAFPNEEETLLELKRELFAIGSRLGRLPSNERPNYLRQHLAVYLVGITYVAWDNYSDGTLWSHLEEALGSPGIPQPELAGFYRTALAEFDLEAFEVKEKRLIGPILIHAGIPRQSQVSYLDRMVREYQKAENLSAEDFNQQIRNFVKADVAGKGFDVPTWRFIGRAGAIADELTEKCLEVLDDIAEDGEWDQGGGEGLPTPLLMAIVGFTRELQLQRKARRRGTTVRMTPAVWLDVESLEIKVLLPQYEQVLGKPVTWSINDGFETVRMPVYPELRGLEAKPKELVLSRVSKEISLQCEEYGEPWYISLSDPDSPISFFKTDGKALPDSGALPGQELIALGPIGSNSEGFRLNFDGKPTSDFRDYGSPTGWSEDPESASWRILGLDLRGLERVSLSQNGEELADSIRYIGQGTPVFNLNGRLVESVEQRGLQVLSSLPSVWLPPVDASNDAHWTIRVRFEASKVPVSKLVEFSSQAQEIFLESSESEGLFTVTVEGKRGSSQRFQGFLVSGLTAAFQPPLRKLNASGTSLEKSTFKLALAGTPFASGVIDDQVDKVVESPTGSELTLRPPHVEIQIRRGPEIVRYLSSVSLDPEELLDAKMHLVWPGQRLERVSARANSQELQTLSIKGQDSKSPYIVLGELTDTARAAGHLDLVALHAGSESRVAVIRVNDFVSEIAMDAGGRVSFITSVEEQGIRCRGYCMQAPWVEPFDLAVENGSVMIPEKYFGFGEIGVMFAIDDPWVPALWPPAFEMIRNSAVVSTASFDDDGSPEASLSRWFQDGVIRDNLRNLEPRLFARLLIDDSIQTVQRSRQDIVALARGLADSFQSTLLPELATVSGALNTSAIEIMFDLDLVDKSFEPREKSSRLNAASPYLSLVAQGYNHWQDLESAHELAQQLFGIDIEAEKTSEVIQGMGLLNRNRLFDDFVLRVNDLNFLNNPDARKIARERLGVVPSQPLHRSRLAGIFLDLLAARNKLEREPLIRPLLDPDALNELSREIRRAMPERSVAERKLLMAKPSDALLEMGGNTALIMSLSIGLSLMARYAPRSSTVAIAYEKYKPLHARLAEILPSLVEYDLVVAELLASYNAAFKGE